MNATSDDRLEYKRHWTYSLHHARCGEYPEGNGSILFPYKCPCGEWQYDMKTFTWRLKR